MFVGKEMELSVGHFEDSACSGGVGDEPMEIVVHVGQPLVGHDFAVVDKTECFVDGCAVVEDMTDDEKCG